MDPVQTINGISQFMWILYIGPVCARHCSHWGYAPIVCVGAIRPLYYESMYILYYETRQTFFSDFP